MTNDASEPYKYSFPSDNPLTLLAPHSYAVVWCDREEGTSALHAPFKLTSDDCTLILTSSDKQYADTLAYISHEGSESVGRYPDGGRDSWLFTRPTPGADNTLTSRSSLYDTPYCPSTAIDVPEPADSNTTSIDSVLYDLFGREVASPISGHIYIRQGKKVLFR